MQSGHTSRLQILWGLLFAMWHPFLSLILPNRSMQKMQFLVSNLNFLKYVSILRKTATKRKTKDNQKVFSAFDSLISP